MRYFIYAGINSIILLEASQTLTVCPYDKYRALKDKIQIKYNITRLHYKYQAVKPL